MEPVSRHRTPVGRRCSEHQRGNGAPGNDATRRLLSQRPRAPEKTGSGDGVRNPRGAPSWVSQWKVRICGSPWMAGRSACAEAPRPQAPPAERRAGRRGRNCRVARNARSGGASARHGQRPPLGGETTVARRTLRDPAARAPRAKGWAWQPNAASAERGPSWPLAATKGASRRPLSCRRPGDPDSQRAGVTRLGVVPADRISEDYSVRRDLELADLGVVGACA